VRDQLNVAFDVELSIQLRHEVEHVDALDGIARTQPAPRLFERGGGLKMPRPRR
jgi:hypothetical protein